MAAAAQRQRDNAEIAQRDETARAEMRARLAEVKNRMPKEHRTLLAAIMDDEDEDSFREALGPKVKVIDAAALRAKHWT